MAKMTLLEQAMAVPNNKRRNKVTVEQMETAVAWMEDTVSLSQIAQVCFKNKASSQMYMHLAIWLREAYRAGLLRTVIK